MYRGNKQKLAKQLKERIESGEGERIKRVWRIGDEKIEFVLRKAPNEKPVWCFKKTDALKIGEQMDWELALNLEEIKPDEYRCTMGEKEFFGM